MATADINSPEYLREQFNHWAEDGRGEGMEEHHLPIVEPMLALIDFAPDDAILDIGCGTGWLARRIAPQAPQGRVMGIDVSDEMIRRARLASAGSTNIEFQTGMAESVPAPAESFTKVISVESAYYWPEPARGVREVSRVLRPGGSAWILINYYRDNPYCHQWGSMFGVPSHLLSGVEWEHLFQTAGFRKTAQRRIVDPTPTPEVYSGRWFRDADEMRRFKAAGAFLVYGTK